MGSNTVEGSTHALKVLVTGGAGFLGAYLTKELLDKGYEVIVMDNLWTGSSNAIKPMENNPRFKFLQHDVTQAFPADLVVDQIYHLACPASPDRFPEKPVAILDTCYFGTRNVLELAKRCKARVLFTSTSEIYGSSFKYPQYETDWGNVNPFGPRSCYDEGKRVAEALTYSYRHEHSLDIRLARIFNTYGPGLSPKDGRVVSNFIAAALAGEELVVYGDGSSTRCFQFVSDCVRGLIMLMQSDYSKSAVNIGQDQETTIQELADQIRELVAQKTGKEPTKVRYIDAKQDDPIRRKPSIELAKSVLNWSPVVSLTEGLSRSIDWYMSLES